MKSSYQLDLEADEEKHRIDRRLRAKIDTLTSLRDVRNFIDRVREAAMSDKMRKRIEKWLRERVSTLKGSE